MKSKTPKRSRLVRQNAACARIAWPEECSESILATLRELTIRFGFSVSMGEVRLLNGGWYVTNSGLLRLAGRHRCRGISTGLVPEFSDPRMSRWIFKATVYKTGSLKGFVGFGDAEPSNVSSVVRGCELRVAETRAVNRALRKAYAVPICSLEELSSISSPWKSSFAQAQSDGFCSASGSNSSQPRLRDRLCSLIRHHQLDSGLVKRYAADYCGTQEIREASRELVESFISHLAEWAGRDRPGLLCKLNSFAPSQEVHL